MFQGHHAVRPTRRSCAHLHPTPRLPCDCNCCWQPCHATMLNACVSTKVSLSPPRILLRSHLHTTRANFARRDMREDVTALPHRTHDCASHLARGHAEHALFPPHISVDCFVSFARQAVLSFLHRDRESPGTKRVYARVICHSVAVQPERILVLALFLSFSRLLLLSCRVVLTPNVVLHNHPLALICTCLFLPVSRRLCNSTLERRLACSLFSQQILVPRER